MKKAVTSNISTLRYLNNTYIEKQLLEAGINDLHTSHGSIIFTLLKKGSMTMKELAKEIHRDKSTLTALGLTTLGFIILTILG